MAAPLDVVVRFSTSNPDIIISITNPGATTALSLKQQIRTHLEEPASISRLRLIHAGKVIPDTEAISKTLHVTFPPPPRAQDAASRSEKAKGKQPIRDPPTPAAPRVYVHCSVGDPLTPANLSAEREAAEKAGAALEDTFLKPSSKTQPEPQDGDQTTTTTPAPRGFDRLLSAGFTPAEITTLRTQFLAIQAHTHTPDTMPTGSALLALEERWLDNTSDPSGSDNDTGGFGSEDAGGLEDMLWGNLMGFFWPVGCLVWGWREEGVWTRRRKIAVLSGILVNVTFGVLRVMN